MKSLKKSLTVLGIVCIIFAIVALLQKEYYNMWTLLFFGITLPVSAYIEDSKAQTPSKDC